MSTVIDAAGVRVPVAGHVVSRSDAEAPVHPAPLVPMMAAAALSSGATAVMLAGVFRGFQPRLVALAAVLIGVLIVAASIRMRRQWMQFLVLPAAVVAGALLVVPDANGQGSANLPDLVLEAVRGGGIIQPPIPFDPGWRFVLVVLAAVLGGGVAAVAAGFNRPRLAVVLPLPLIMVGELAQPPGADVVPTLVAGVMVVTGLAVAHGADLVGRGVLVSKTFERRRLVRTAIMLLGLTAGVTAAAQAGFLFPQPSRSRAVPPQRPEVPPPAVDRALFSYRTDHPTPIRMGTLDTYDAKQQAWLLPPFDATTFRPVNRGRVTGRAGKTTATFTTKVIVKDEAGHVLPGVAGTERIDGLSEAIDFDPRTQTLRLRDQRLRSGLAYTLTVEAPPSGHDLASSGPPGDDVKAFLDAPPAPNEVVALLGSAPADPFDRLQVLRQALFSRVIAAGTGKPVDLPLRRVVDMLNGKEASPYEITAAEALLARWAGVPSRIGYGYNGGKQGTDGSYEVHPRDGAMWLEAYFNGYGWIPIVGTPLKAKSSTSDQQKNHNPAVKPSDLVGLVMYVPVRVTSPLLYFQVAQYYMSLVMPYVLLVVILLLIHPGLIKLLRAAWRRQWAARRGYRQRVLVAYAGFRDLANDLAYGDPHATPLEFLAAIEEDQEHQEIAWLVTRGLWGDLRDDLTADDADRAVELAGSIMRRLMRAQTGLNLVLGLLSRTSLRDPYSRALPNPWPAPRQLRPGTRRRRSRLLLPTVRRLIPGLAILLSVLLLTSCADAGFRGPTQLMGNLVPQAVGPVNLVSEPALAAGFREAGPAVLAQKAELFTLRHDDVVEGSVQIYLLKQDVRADNDLVFAGMEAGIGGRKFTRVRLVPERRVWLKELVDQRIYMWFPPESNAIELVVLRKSFIPYRSLVTGLLDFQEGRAPKAFDLATPAPSAAP